MAHNIVLEFWDRAILAALVKHAHRLDFRCSCSRIVHARHMGMRCRLGCIREWSTERMRGSLVQQESLLVCRKPPDAPFKETSLALLTAARAGMPEGTTLLF